MNKDITYSFIIPHKNNPDLLQRCVNSIPRRDDIQIVVVDDNSSIDIVDWNSFKFDDERCIELIHTKGCKSAGAVRNEGLKQAKGKWVLFADCDDYYVDGFLGVLDIYVEKDIEVLFFSLDCIDGVTKSQLNSKMRDTYDQYESNPAFINRIRFFKPPWTKMVRKSFLDRFQIQFEDVILGNDVWYSYQVGYFAKKVEVVNKRLYIYTVNANSISFHRTVAKDVVQIEAYVKQNSFFRFIGRSDWQFNLLGMIRYHWLNSNRKIKYAFALLVNAWRIYKVRNKYVDGIRERLGM